MCSQWESFNGTVISTQESGSPWNSSEVRAMVSKKWQKSKGEIKVLLYSSVHPSWVGLEDLPHPTKDLKRRCWCLGATPLLHSSLHTQIPTRSQPWLNLPYSPALSMCGQPGYVWPNRVYNAYRNNGISSPFLSLPRTPWILIGQLSRELCSLLSRFLITPFRLYSVAKIWGLELKHQRTGQGWPWVGRGSHTWLHLRVTDSALCQNPSPVYIMGGIHT